MKIRTWDKSGSKNEQNLRYYANIKKVIEVAAVEYVPEDARPNDFIKSRKIDEWI